MILLSAVGLHADTVGETPQDEKQRWGVLAYIRTGHRLETSVAMHFWYDFLLSAAAFAADPQHQPFVVQYSAPM